MRPLPSSPEGPVALSPPPPGGLLALAEGGEVLVADGAGFPKVVRLADGRIAKRIAPGPMGGVPDSRPRSLRFAGHCGLLRARGFRTPEVESIHTLGPGRSHLILYRPLEGVTLRAAARDRGRRPVLLRSFAAFLARLHGAGVSFRQGHLANYILGPDGEFGLIDVHGTVLFPGSVPAVERALTTRILVKDPEDREFLCGEGGFRLFFGKYAAARPAGGALAAAATGWLARLLFRAVRENWDRVPAAPSGGGRPGG